MTLSRRLQLVLCFGVLVTILGCGEGGPTMNAVTGKVTIGGQPAADVLVTFQPTDSTMEAASGRTGTDGSYTLTSGIQGKPGAMTGSYKVVLQQQSSADEAAYAGGGGQSAPPSGPETNIPEEYSSAETTPMTKDVASGANTIDIAIE
jgi:hypothetical protein